jgi:hypothetical protein
MNCHVTIAVSAVRIKYTEGDSEDSLWGNLPVFRRRRGVRQGEGRAVADSFLKKLGGFFPPKGLMGWARMHVGGHGGAGEAPSLEMKII